MIPSRVQLSRKRGWRKPAGAVVVSRPSRWGNPYTIAEHGREKAVALYRQRLAENPELVEAARRELAVGVRSVVDAADGWVATQRGVSTVMVVQV
jgi:hypothetical protein